MHRTSRLQKAFLRTAIVCFFLFGFIAMAATNDVETAMVTDSDGDGMSDWDEWQAGTNPGDPTNCFNISSAAVQDDQLVLKWRSVSSSTYEVVRSSTVEGLSTDPEHVAFVRAEGGSGPWYQALSTVTNDISSAGLFFRIQLVPEEDFELTTLDMSIFE